jgi:hypothetical protein
MIEAPAGAKLVSANYHFLYLSSIKPLVVILFNFFVAVVDQEPAL